MKGTFFISGIPRSGTTLLERMLDNHSKIAVSPESNVFEILKRTGAEKEFTSSWHYQQFIQGLASWLIGFHDPAHSCLMDYYQQHPAYSGSSRLLLQSLAAAYLERKGKEIFGEKHPHHIHYQSFIHSVCPEAKLIILLRHPLDLCCSIAKGLLLKEKFRNQPDQLSDPLLLTSATFVKQGLRDIFLPSPFPTDQRHLLMYEELISSPQATLKKVCTFLDLSYEPGMEIHQVDTYLNPENKSHQIIHKKLFDPIDPTHLSTYKNYLSGSQTAMLSLFLKKELPLIPYTLPMPAARLSPHQKWLLFRHKLRFAMQLHLWKEWIIRFKFKLKSGFPFLR